VIGNQGYLTFKLENKTEKGKEVNTTEQTMNELTKYEEMINNQQIN